MKEQDEIYVLSIHFLDRNAVKIASTQAFFIDKENAVYFERRLNVYWKMLLDNISDFFGLGEDLETVRRKAVTIMIDLYQDEVHNSSYLESLDETIDLLERKEEESKAHDIL